MALAIMNLVVALLLGYGAVDELWQRGVLGGETQPLVIGIVGVLASLALGFAGIARLRRWPNTRQLTIFAAVALIAFHAYAALPPHRNVGILALAVAVGYGLLLLAVSLVKRGGARAAQAAG